MKAIKHTKKLKVFLAFKTILLKILGGKEGVKRGRTLPSQDNFPKLVNQNPWTYSLKSNGIPKQNLPKISCVPFSKNP